MTTTAGPWGRANWLATGDDSLARIDWNRRAIRPSWPNPARRDGDEAATLGGRSSRNDSRDRRISEAARLKDTLAG
jgi:hypothetical protein